MNWPQRNKKSSIDVWLMLPFIAKMYSIHHHNWHLWHYNRFLLINWYTTTMTRCADLKRLTENIVLPLSSLLSISNKKNIENNSTQKNWHAESTFFMTNAEWITENRFPVFACRVRLRYRSIYSRKNHPWNM